LSTIPRNINPPQFKQGDKVISLVHHPPEVASGDQLTIIEPHLGLLYAVKLPDGEIHEWLAGTELQAVNQNSKILRVGSSAKVMDNYGHAPSIYKGMIVKIVKIFSQVYYYDVKLENGKYHRWLAEFEIAYPI